MVLSQPSKLRTGVRFSLSAPYRIGNIMTTKVTVDAHAGWPVSVTYIVGEPHLSTRIETEVVPPHTTRDFYIHSGMRISNIEELPSIDE